MAFRCSKRAQPAITSPWKMSPTRWSFQLSASARSLGHPYREDERSFLMAKAKRSSCDGWAWWDYALEEYCSYSPTEPRRKKCRTGEWVRIRFVRIRAEAPLLASDE